MRQYQGYKIYGNSRFPVEQIYLSIKKVVVYGFVQLTR